MFTSEEEFDLVQREREADMMPATTLSEAHAHWHYVHGWNTVCDLDCGAGEAYDEMYEDDDEDFVMESPVIPDEEKWILPDPWDTAAATEGWEPPF